MRKVLVLLASAIVGTAASSFGQTIWSENFENTADSSLPAGWSQVSTAAGAWKTGVNTFLQSNDYPISAHTKMVGVNDDKSGQSGPNSNNSNDLLVTNTIDLSSATNPFLSFDLYYSHGTYQGATESLTVEVSTNGGSSWTVLSTLAGNTVTPWETRFYSLSAYAGQANVKIGFRYGDGSGWLFGAALDNIKVFTPIASDIALTSVSPVAGSPTAYEVVGAGVTLKGTVFNNGGNAITSYVIKYQQGSGPVVTDTKTGVNIAPFTSATFTDNSPFNVPGLGNYNLKIWVELTGDNAHANDTATTIIAGAAFKPSKRLLIEEATGTWCGWCVRGIVYMDSLFKLNPADVSLVAVHNLDPMVVSAYDTWMGTKIQGYPSVVVDRREVADPSDILTMFGEERNYFGFAEIQMGSPAFTGNNFTLPVTVKPAIDLSGDYRLALVLTEDAVHSTAGGNWDQHNYYSYASQNQPLSGNGINYQALPNPIPSAQVYYDFVARSIVPSVTGAAGSLPATMTANSSYNYSFTATVDPSWVKSNTRAIVMLIRNSDGAVLNTNNTRWALGINNLGTILDGAHIYPNPTRDVAYATFNLTQSSKIQVQVIDAAGRVISTVADEYMTSGEHKVEISTAALASGLYNVKIQTENGNIVERLSVIK